MSTRKLSVGGLATILWLGLAAVLALPALAAAPEAPETNPATGVTSTTATLHGVLNPKTSAKAGWYFDYTTELTCTLGKTTPQQAEVEGKALPEQLEVTGLEPGKTYTACMFATNEAAEATEALNEVTFKTLAATPTIDSQSASSVNSTAATLEAQVNPNNQETTFSFEYSTKATGQTLEGTITTVNGAAPLAAEFGDRTATVPRLEGLTPGTTYFYRVIAKDATGTSTGTVTSVTTVPTPNTDTPTSITANGATLNGHLTLNATDSTYSFLYNAGSECTGGSSTTVEDAGTGSASTPEHTAITGLQPTTQYTACFVTSNAFGSEQGPPVSFETVVAVPSVTESVSDVAATSATLEAQVNPGGAATTYHFEYDTSPYSGSTEHGTNIPIPDGTISAGIVAVGVSEHAQSALAAGNVYHYRIVATNRAGTTDGPDQTFTTEVTGAGFVLPDNRAWEMVSPPNKDGAEIENTHTREGGVLESSEEGNAITYLASSPIEPNPAGSPIETQVMSRRSAVGGWSSEDIATPAAEGLHIGEVAEYKAFTSDLSLALVHPTGSKPLAPPAPGGGSYTRDNNTGTYTPTTQGPHEWFKQHVPAPARTCDTSTSPAGGDGTGASANGCYVYWDGPSGVELSHYNGSQWVTTFVASSRDDTYRVSPNGEYFAFMSNARLTSYDNRDAISGVPDQEVYVYHAATDSLVCASCNPSGARPIGVVDSGGGGLGLLVDRTESFGGQSLAGLIPVWTNINVSNDALRQPRYLSDSGQLFFDSADSLVPQDVNGQIDVYEYEPKGLGSCAAIDGCVSLISAGTSNVESGFIDASASGSDVFFLTRSRLLPQDFDGYYDMYDAHVCTASAPCQSPPPATPPPCDTGDSCKAAPSQQPQVYGAPASATFEGAGNVASAAAPVAKPKPPTRAQKLAAALKTCRKLHKARQRHGCEASARKRLGTKSHGASAKSSAKTTTRDHQGA